MCDAQYVVADGTFKIHPVMFAQLYILHAPYFGQVFPMLFCLLPNKSFKTYFRLLNLIISVASKNGFRFCPPKIHIDYEKAMIKAISNIFSSDIIQGCFFHFSQSVWRKAQELGMASAYIKHDEVRLWINRMRALAFLPLDENFDEGYLTIQETAPSPILDDLTEDQITKFHNYMVNTWVDDIDALFDRKLWNQYSNIGPRTTNNAEGFNSKLNKKAGKRHAFFPFIDLLHEIQEEMEFDKIDILTNGPKPRKPKYVKIDKAVALAKKIMQLVEFLY